MKKIIPLIILSFIFVSGHPPKIKFSKHHYSIKEATMRANNGVLYFVDDREYYVYKGKLTRVVMGNITVLFTGYYDPVIYYHGKISHPDEYIISDIYQVIFKDVKFILSNYDR